MFSRLKSIAGFKCPKCSVGDLFPNNDFFDFKLLVNKKAFLVRKAQLLS